MVSRRTMLAISGLGIVATSGCLGEDGGDGESGSDVAARNPEAPLVTTTDDGNDELVLATYGDVVEVSTVDYNDQQGRYYVPIGLTEEATDSFVDDLESIGAFDAPSERELAIHAADEVVDTPVIGRSLADAMQAGEWDGSLQIGSADEGTLLDLRSELDIE
ncbi:hypothetical protein EA462_01515 [Natrarchaeobius halalkaliphilus]|uniref:Preprotein translocase subunit SecD n=1 Tax=Natrarchaeobius halalkaliphilus TaxID=1679091 RepID=A0A3N6LVW3_9EURY|nr:hypothetical protein [Natrarchaeobius halalkaliphilus]RQG92927.1 hypothetical protein EA462_01515 [Natrarchaeobius halalkaliphilus]